MPLNQSLYSLCIDTWTFGPFFCIDLHSCCLPGASAPEQAGGRYLGRGHTYKQLSTPLINTFVGLIFTFITALYYWSLLSETSFLFHFIVCRSTFNFDITKLIYGKHLILQQSNLLYSRPQFLWTFKFRRLSLQCTWTHKK